MPDNATKNSSLNTSLLESAQVFNTNKLNDTMSTSEGGEHLLDSDLNEEDSAWEFPREKYNSIHKKKTHVLKKKLINLIVFKDLK
jgi:hypothetical protein